MDHRRRVLDLDLPDGEIVVKPSVSGGGFQTARYLPHEHGPARRHIAELTASGRTAMVQPYQRAVDDAGEVGLIFLGGGFSHAMHKDPMIRRGTGPRPSLIENQVVTPAIRLGRPARPGPRRRRGRGAPPRPRQLRPGGHGRGRRRSPAGPRARAARSGPVLRHRPCRRGAFRPRPGRPARLPRTSGRGTATADLGDRPDLAGGSGYVSATAASGSTTRKVKLSSR